MSEVEGLTGIAYEEAKKFRPRVIGGGTAALLLAALLAAAVAFSSGLIVETYGDRYAVLGGLETLRPLFVAVAIVCAFLGCARAIYDRARTCPPPTWRIQDELRLYLQDAGMLPRDSTLWRSLLKMRPASYDRAASCITMWFWVASSKATEDAFKDVKHSQIFRHAQDVEIKKHTNRRGRWDGYDLCIWYRPEDDVFQRILKRGR